MEPFVKYLHSIVYSTVRWEDIMKILMSVLFYRAALHATRFWRL